MSENECADARELLLEQGKELAARTILAYERWARCPFNVEEAAQVRSVQKQFVEWERAANAQCRDLDTATLFADSRLRPFQRELTIGDLARLRRMPSLAKAHLVSIANARRAQPAVHEEADDGIWPSAGPGI